MLQLFVSWSQWIWLLSWEVLWKICTVFFDSTWCGNLQLLAFLITASAKKKLTLGCRKFAVTSFWNVKQNSTSLTEKKIQHPAFAFLPYHFTSSKCSPSHCETKANISTKSSNNYFPPGMSVLIFSQHNLSQHYA